MTRLIKKLLERRSLLILGLLYTLAITIVMVFPGKDLPKSDLPLDKLLHVLINMCLVLIWLLYFHVKASANLNRRMLFTVLTAVFIYGIIIEIIQQQFVVHRHADIWDVVANTIGLILGFVVFLKVKHLIHPKINI